MTVAPHSDILIQICSQLELLILRYCATPDPFLEIVGAAPAFLSGFLPDHGHRIAEAELANRFPFLENYLIDAKQTCWHGMSPRTESAIWSEVDVHGNELLLEVAAVCVGQHNLLLIHGNQQNLHEKERLYQVARTGELAFARREQEAQKQDILFHCIVHDLATPLATLSGSLELLAQEPLSETALQLIQTCQRAVTRQESLIHDVLDVFEADRGGIAPRTSQRADVRSGVASTVALLQSKAAWRRIAVESVSASAGPLHVVGEQTRLERVLTNLLDNALRYAPVGSTIRIALQEEPMDVLVSIDDEGPGVPKEIGATMFEKFGGDRKSGGKIGLGLYFCKITITRWGGQIGYSPRDGNGARFWFRLPKWSR